MAQETTVVLAVTITWIGLFCGSKSIIAKRQNTSNSNITLRPAPVFLSVLFYLYSDLARGEMTLFHRHRKPKCESANF